MEDVRRRVVTSILTVVAIGIAAMCLLQIFGGFFFYSFWYYVPPVCALAMFAVIAIGESRLRLSVAYSLFAVFILSYVVRNWGDVDIASQESDWLVIVPHVLQFALCSAMLLLAHRRG